MRSVEARWGVGEPIIKLLITLSMVLLPNPQKYTVVSGSSKEGV